jgi:hypothetical protein
VNYVVKIVDRLRAVVADAGGSLPSDRLTIAYALLVLTTGQATTLENVHDAWSTWRAFSDRPDHRDLVTFAELMPSAQVYDRPYRDAIRAVAAELEAEREKAGLLT